MINLATRDKATFAPAVNYPVYLKRPGSASVTLTTPSARLVSATRYSNSRSKSTSNLVCTQGQRRASRPVSADCNSITQPRQNKSPLTSSNIYKLLLAEPIKRSWMTSGANTPNNDSTTTGTIEHNAIDNKMDESNLKTLSNDTDSDDTISCEEDIEEKVLSQSSDDNGDGIFNFNTSNESPKSMTEQVLKTTVTKPKVVSSFGVTKSNSGNGNGSQFSSSLHPIKESKTSQPLSKAKFHSNSYSKDKDTPHQTNAETTSSDSKVTFNMLKADLPGRVSFSKNDVFEIDYSDYENDTDTSRSLEPGEVCRKKNVHFEDEFFQVTGTVASVIEGKEKINVSSPSSSGGSSDDDRTTEIDSGPAKMVAINDEYKYCCSLKCNDRNCLNESAAYVSVQQPATTKMPLLNAAHADTNGGIDNSEKIIEEYKREIENINRRHELELKWSGNRPLPHADYPNGSNEAPQIIANDENNIVIVSSNAEPTNEFSEKEQLASDYWSSPDTANSPVANSKRTVSTSNASEDSPTRDSTSTVINNYLKTKNSANNAPPKATSTTSIILRTTSATKKTPPSQSSNGIGNGRKIKSAQCGAVSKSGQHSKLSKARSISCLQKNANDVTKLNEFHIDKVESWMSTHHEDTFSDTALSTSRKNKFGGSSTNLEYKKAWRETPTSNKTDDEGNFSLDDQLDSNSVDDSSCGEIELVLKKMEGRRMKISFDSIKNTPTVPSLSIGSSSLSQQTQHQIISNANSANDHSSDKIKEIFQYLDEVDYNCDRTINNIQLQKIPESYRSDIEYNLDATDIVGDLPQMTDLLMLSNEQLARRIIALTLRTNELSNAIQLSKEHVDKMRNDTQKVMRLEKQAAQVRLKEQKTHYEGIVTRHQAFIEQLLKDKASLCEKVSALTRRIESQHQSSEHKLQAEIVRVKEAALAGEKIRRERWVRENTKKIKELTVKGLEQEINKMQCNHQKEVMELKRRHQQEILDAVEEARQKHEVSEMGIRDSYAHDREVAIEKERNAIRERFERQMEIERKSFEEQKLRLIGEFNAEKERWLSEHRHNEHEFEVRRDKWQHEKKELAEHLHREYADKVRNIEKRNQSEIASIREQFESDFTIWKREHETMYKLREVENANTIRQQCRLERDKQIDSIVAKVDAESLKIQQDYETKISRLKGKYDAELRDMERIERQSHDKFTEARSKLAEYEANIQNLHASVKQLEIQLSHSQRMCDSFAAEKEHFKENARKEMQQDIEALRKERHDEILQVHKRVQHAIAKKDASMDVLQKENATLKDRCLKMETIIRQQRKDYCTK